MDNNMEKYFPGLKECTYLNTSNNALGNVKAKQAYDEVLTQWLAGSFDFTESESKGESLRSCFADLIKADRDEIAMCSFLSSAAGVIAEQFKPTNTDNVVLADLEFSSNYYPWLSMRDKGFEIRQVESGNGKFTLESFEKAINENTRLVAVSAVQSSSGFKVDLDKISELCTKNNALLFVDASQAMGTYPINVQKTKIDFLATVNYKYLLGARGIAYLYINKTHHNELRAITPGWRSAAQPMSSFYGPGMTLSSNASKMDTSLAWFPAHADIASFKLMQDIGWENIYRTNSELRNHFITRLREEDILFNDYGIDNTANALSIPLLQPESIKLKLEQMKIITSVRMGNLRASFHFYNSIEHIDRLIDVLKQTI